MLDGGGSDLRPYDGSGFITFLYMKLESDVVSVVRTTGVKLLCFFYSGIQLYVLLSPYLCFISFLYLDLYVLGDDARISKKSFVRTKHLFVLIYIRIKG